MIEKLSKRKRTIKIKAMTLLDELRRESCEGEYSPNTKRFTCESNVQKKDKVCVLCKFVTNLVKQK